MRGAWLAAALAVLVSGCLELPSERDLSPPPPEERPPPDLDRSMPPEDVAAEALARLVQDLGPSGAVQRIRGSAGMEGFQATFDLELGSDGAYRLVLGFGGLFTATLHCRGEEGVVQLGTKVLQARPPGPCEEADLGGLEANLTGGPSSSLVRAQRGADGDVTATYREPGQDGAPDTERTFRIDPAGRVAELRQVDESGEATAELTYGPRRALGLPEPTHRMPAEVLGMEDFEDGTYSWTAVAGEEARAPLGEFEVRLVTGPEEAEVVIATFRPAQPGPQVQAGYTFEFADDGDGLLGTGDAFTIERPAWSDPLSPRVVVYDTWAGAALGENPVPGVEALGFLAALGAAALGARRRGGS